MTNILIRCDGSPEIGLGHIIRCLALADEFHEVHNCRITFAMRKGPLGIKMVEEKGYKVIISQENDQTFDYKEWLNECVSKVDARAIVFDVRDGLARAVVKELRTNGTLIISIDDPENKRLEADLAFYPPVPQVRRMDWSSFTGQLYVGWEWVILRKEFSRAPCPMPHAPCTKIPIILVTMGGSDPQRMTFKVVKALEMFDKEFEVIVVLGAGFQHKEEFNNLLSRCKHRYDVREDVQNMAELMTQSDIALSSFGATAYELAAMGLPAIYLCLTDDHAESASVFEEAGTATNLGVYSRVVNEKILQFVLALVEDKGRRTRMSIKAKACVDAQGTKRIAELIVLQLE